MFFSLRSKVCFTIGLSSAHALAVDVPVGARYSSASLDDVVAIITPNQGICSGVRLGRNVVMTAAHCLDLCGDPETSGTPGCNLTPTYVRSQAGGSQVVLAAAAQYSAGFPRDGRIPQGFSATSLIDEVGEDIALLFISDSEWLEEAPLGNVVLTFAPDPGVYHIAGFGRTAGYHTGSLPGFEPILSESPGFVWDPQQRLLLSSDGSNTSLLFLDFEGDPASP
jgi:hypothetical protein